jgi:hypothetical protein
MNENILLIFSSDEDEDVKPKDIDMDVENRDELDDRKFKNNYKFSYSVFFIEEDEDDNVRIPGVGPIAMHASNRDDPLLEIQDDVRLLFILLRHKYDLYRGKIPMLKIILFDPMIILLLLHILKMILPVWKYMVKFIFNKKKFNSLMQIF